MRPVAVAKPHLFKGAECWWCCQAFHRLGRGGSPQEAFQNWLRANV